MNWTKTVLFEDPKGFKIIRKSLAFPLQFLAFIIIEIYGWIMDRIVGIIFTFIVLAGLLALYRFLPNFFWIFIGASLLVYFVQSLIRDTVNEELQKTKHED